MPIKYVPFIPEPVEGQAVLANFNRVLKYKGTNDVQTTLQRGMPLYEMEKQEQVGENPDGNIVIRGECVSACAYLKERGIQVDLVYIDPPFASGADYAKKVYVRRNPKVAAAVAQAERDLSDDELRNFEEKMYGDVWDKEKYLNWMYENLMAIKSVMSETASVYVHLDWHIGHYVKILMDEVFGEECFQNEIIWQKIRTTKAQSSQFGNVHDSIFCYRKSNDAYFENIYVPYSEEYIKKHYKPDSQGRLFTDVSLVQRGPGSSRLFNGIEMFPPAGMHWIWTQEKIDAALSEGRIIFNSKGTPRKVQYLDEMEGDIASDLWCDIYPVNSQATEDVDYSTQKPETLLDRIVKASSNEGMLVADFFGGSGVTAAVAAKLGRRFIHCDIGLNSLQTTRDRLITDGAEFDVLEIKDGVQLYRNPVQTMDKIKSLIPGLKNEDSLDSFWEGAISDSRLGTIPVYVPNLMDSSSKLLDKVMMNRIIHQAIPDLDASVKKVIVYYIDITSVEEIEAFIKEDDSTTVEIELRDMKAILDDVVIGDYAEFHTEDIHTDLYGGYQVVIDKFISDRVMQKIDDFNNKSRMNATAKRPFRPIEISEEGLELIEFLSLDCTAADGEWHSDSEIKIDKNGYVIANGAKTQDFWDGSIRSVKRPLRLKIRNICGDETVWGVK